MSSSTVCGCDESKANVLELAAWRFLATHRAEGLHVTHVQFIDDGDHKRMNTPSRGDIGLYEISSGETFGEAAIVLALALGMPWPSIDSRTSPSGPDSAKSTAPIASAGASSKNSPRTRSHKTAGTTDVTGAVADIDANDARPSGGDRDAAKPAAGIK